jgi:signal transduction histidine kinase
MTDKFERYHSVHSWFAKNSEIYTSTRKRALEVISKKICDAMGIQRLGVWMFTITHDAIYEENTHSVIGQPSHGKILSKEDHPGYFKKINEERVISVDSSKVDQDLKKFAEIYMNPLNVCSLLDAPIFSDGTCIGVLCCETTDVSHRWDMHDKNFAAACADFIGRIIEAEKRHSYEKELKHRIDYLENDLQKKIDDLRGAKLTLELALEAAQAGKWDWDIITGKLNLSNTWYTRLGYEFEELPQELSTFIKVLHPDDVERTFETLEKHLKGQTAFYECRYRMVTKTGEIQWCIDRGSVSKRSPEGSALFATGVNINITPIIQLEQSLLVSELQLTAMITSLPTPVAMFDREFRYLAYSSRWYEDWHSWGEIKIGHQMTNSSMERKSMWIKHMQQALGGETLSKDEDFIQLTPEIQLWLKWIIQPWQLANGDIGGVVIMAENITLRKDAEMKIAQSSKLSALGEMAGGIAHEINNPLSIIKGYIDLLKRHSSRKSLSEEMMLQYIEKMDITVGRISRIVNGMRRFSRESSMDEKVEYSLNKIIDETLDICLERINNNGTALNVEYFVGEPMVFCRPVEISQVLLNLINNSFQAISIFPHPWIKIQCREVGNHYEMNVSDCGPGIPAFIRQKLFQPFFTTKDIGVGTGLGLSISRGIIEEHRGHLDYVDEAPNTTFLIKLPKLHTEDN